MKVTVKALVLAAMMAAGTANAYTSGDTGNGSLIFVLADTVSNNFAVIDLGSQLSSWLPTAKGGNKDAAGVNQNFNLSSSAALSAFFANNTNSANWSWSVLAFDNTPTNAQGIATADARRYLMTYNNTANQGAGSPINADGSTRITSANFGGIQGTKPENTFNAAANQNEAYAGNGSYWFDALNGRIPDGVGNKVNESSSFFYLTGRSGTAAATQFANQATWTFTNTNGVLNLNYSTTPAAVVPETDTFAMLLAGLGVMGMVARRRLAA